MEPPWSLPTRTTQPGWFLGFTLVLAPDELEPCGVEFSAYLRTRAVDRRECGRWYRAALAVGVLTECEEDNSMKTRSMLRLSLRNFRIMRHLKPTFTFDPISLAVDTNKL